MVHLLGIRHHGVGSAKNVLAALEKLQPDIVLVEGAPELDAVVSWIGHEELVPPVAVLGYQVDNPQQATFYPFAAFSPEWQAIQYANERKIPVKMIDAPLFALTEIEKSNNYAVEKDPLSYFAMLEGFSDSGEWWDYRFERQYGVEDCDAYFEAVMLVMQHLRDANIPSALEHENIYREAFMRQHIRQAKKQMYHTVVVICGAWHAPALVNWKQLEKSDNALLKSLPKSKLKTGVTWIPWTNARLSMHSGYGAGISAPGWSEYRWLHPEDKGELWLSKVAQRFRQASLPISTAHIIEAYRLTEALCMLRERTYPSISDLNEAVSTVMCMGDETLLAPIQKELIIGERIGQVPKALPKHPLQADFELLSKKLKLSHTPEQKVLELDLRKPLDLSRSVFLARLEILQISWAKQTEVSSKGTFKEKWVLQWRPEMMIALIEQGTWGNTIELAAMHFLQYQADQTQQLGVLATLIQKAIPAELLANVEGLLWKTNNIAAVSTDILDLMSAVAPLVQISRYGNIRKTNTTDIQTIVTALIERICIGLPNAVLHLDEDTAYKMFDAIRAVHQTTKLFGSATLLQRWELTLFVLTQKRDTAPIIGGGVSRLLLENKVLNQQDIATKMSFALSNATDYAAAWMEGFLKGSSLILLYDDVLWNLIFEWVSTLSDEAFMDILPVLRRTFSKFTPLDRRRLGEKVQDGLVNISQNSNTNTAFAIDVTTNTDRGVKTLTTTAQLLGL